MAAPRLTQAWAGLVRFRVAMATSPRFLSSTTAALSIQDWRIKHGLSPDGGGYGPLADLPDWSFADGRPAPPQKSHLQRHAKREALMERVVLLSSQMDGALRRWEAAQGQRAQRRAEESRGALRPKGLATEAGSGGATAVADRNAHQARTGRRTRRDR
ncbi:large ribosomal subunit protein mL52-like isoform X2 [Petromyzon marinus]|uniref:large ribosomal subunit protein mL52-like isoform X2 n=1 Tax=Petromyzon marinus TaxID=7757 RepID=UPI003F730465